VAIRLADSDVLIDYLNRRRPYEQSLRMMLDAGELGVSTVSMFEVFSGVRAESQRDQAYALFAQVEVIPLSEPAALRAAELRQELERRGMPLPPADLLIAATAMTLGIPVLTRNVRHFGRIDGLAVESP
jgi:tRNA(fMet)-specific endonuclease VapC